MSGTLVVPSDITLLENKKQIGLRKVPFLERVGILGMAPMYHMRFTKMDKNDVWDVLRKKYDPMDATNENKICQARQISVQKRALAHNGMYAGAGAFGFGTYWSFRRYNYQSRLLAVPFMAYAGSFVGRAVGDWFTGRNQEYYNDRFLGDLPSKVYYTGKAEQ